MLHIGSIVRVIEGIKKKRKYSRKHIPKLISTIDSRNEYNEPS